MLKEILSHTQSVSHIVRNLAWLQLLVLVANPEEGGVEACFQLRVGPYCPLWHKD